MKVAIIGSGIAGIAASIRMAARGYEVDVYESADAPGGKMAEYNSGNYRFDAGPSLFTMPQYVEALFKVAQTPIDDYFNYQKLDILCQYFWEDGTELTAWDDKDLFAREVENKLNVPARIIHDYLAKSKLKYEATGRIFLEKSLHKWGTWLTKDVLNALIKLNQFDIFKTMNQANKQMVKDPKLTQFYNRFATYNGSNPYKASGMLTIIPYLEQGFGAYLPEKGMFQIPQSLYKLALSMGVTYHFGQKVNKIVTQNKKVTGIDVLGSFHAYEIVICNMDVFLAYQQLLSDEKAPHRILKQEKSSSALIFYWGIPKDNPKLDVHNIFFSDNYKREFEAISTGTVDDDPTVYINITSKKIPTDAPVNSENWFTMINVPYNSGQNWNEIIDRSRLNIQTKLDRILGMNVAKCLETELILEPRTIESKTQSHLGALYGTSSNSQMAAFFRHPNFSPFIKNLYFCGGSAHPGGGIPLCLLSAKIVDDLIHNKNKAN